MHFFIGWPMPRHGVLQNIFWNVDEYRAGSAGCCNVECLTNSQWKIFRAHHQFVVLGNAARNTYGVAFLKSIGTNCRGGNLPSNGNHGNGVHIRIAQRRDQVGSSRAASNHGYARATSDVGITFGHVPRALFVAHQNVTNRRLQERVVGGQNAATRIAEHDVDTFHLERFDERFSSCDFHLTLLYHSFLLVFNSDNSDHLLRLNQACVAF